MSVDVFPERIYRTAPMGLAPRRFPKRICAQPDCGTILSMYNPRTRCSLHTPKAIGHGGPGVGRKRKVA